MYPYNSVNKEKKSKNNFQNYPQRHYDDLDFLYANYNFENNDEME